MNQRCNTAALSNSRKYHRGHFIRLAGVARRIVAIPSLFVMILIGCQNGATSYVQVPGPISEPAELQVSAAAGPSHVAKERDPAERDTIARPPQALGKFHMTFYYVVSEDDVPRAQHAAVVTHEDINDGGSENSLGGGGTLAMAAVVTRPPAEVTVYSRGCTALAKVSRAFASAMVMQGSGKLRDGRTLNVNGSCDCPYTPCFKETFKWGNGGNGRPLAPFRTVAVDPKVVSLGRKLYIPKLVGKRMPGAAPWGGFVHDGCVTAGDTGGAIDGHQLDFFVGRRPYYRALANASGSHNWSKSMDVYDGTWECSDAAIERRMAARSQRPSS